MCAEKEIERKGDGKRKESEANRKHTIKTRK